MTEIPGWGDGATPYELRADPTYETIPDDLVGEYDFMNGRIAEDRVRWADMQSGHLERSKQEILQTAGAALGQLAPGEEPTAIVLGAGGCADIPVAELAEDYKLTLADVSTEQAERALDGLTARQLGNITVLKAEISGIAVGVHEALERSRQASQDYDECVVRAALLLRQLQLVGSQAELGGDYAFVCSQLVLTQMLSVPVMRYGRLVREQYGRNPIEGEGRHAMLLLEAANRHNIEAQAGHVRMLGRLARTDGAVHLADTLTVQEGGREFILAKEEAMVEVAVGFRHLRRPTEWLYTASPQQEFGVASFALAPKPAA